MSGSGRRILVVDDQQDIRELTASVLGGAGYDVRTLGCGADAVDLIAGESFDLVLLDINMPGMDGWETLRLIRADELAGGLPVVMFSVKGDFGDKVLSMQEGALDYITKPFEIDELLGRLDRIFETLDGGLAESPPVHPVP